MNMFTERMIDVIENYDVYKMSSREKVLYISIAAILIMGVGYLFYRSIVASLILCPLAVYYPKIKSKDLIIRRKKLLVIQFKEMLYSLSSSLSAGKSVESAISEVIKDLQIMYPNKNTYIIVEAQNISKKVNTNHTIEEIFHDFSERANVEDIKNFAEILKVCKRTGGNMVEVIKNSSNIINDKIETREEIETLLAQRKFEGKILNIMPILMMFMLSLSAPDYVRPLFVTNGGRVAVSIALVLLVSSYLISQKIMDIKI